MTTPPIFPHARSDADAAALYARARTRAELPELNEDTPTHIVRLLAGHAPMSLMGRDDLTYLSASLARTEAVARNPTLSDAQVADIALRWGKRIRNIGAGTELGSMNDVHAALVALDAARGGLPEAAVRALTALIKEEESTPGPAAMKRSAHRIRLALLHCRHTALPPQTWVDSGTSEGWGTAGGLLRDHARVTDDDVRTMLTLTNGNKLARWVVEEFPEVLQSPQWRAALIDSPPHLDVLRRLAEAPLTADEVRGIVRQSVGMDQNDIHLVVHEPAMLRWFQSDPDAALPLLQHRDPAVREMGLVVTARPAARHL